MIPAGGQGEPEGSEPDRRALAATVKGALETHRTPWPWVPHGRARWRPRRVGRTVVLHPGPPDASTRRAHRRRKREQAGQPLPVPQPRAPPIDRSKRHGDQNQPSQQIHTHHRRERDLVRRAKVGFSPSTGSPAAPCTKLRRITTHP